MPRCSLTQSAYRFLFVSSAVSGCVLDAGDRPCLGAGLVVLLVVGPGSD
jgi:hypothetical protein